ncbi:MAG: hypothetical protein RR037_05380 [Alistipes sp.]
MKKAFPFWAVIATAMTIFGGCSDDPTPQPDPVPIPPDPVATQSFEITCPAVDITTTEASFSIIPTDKTATYYYNIVEKSTIDKLATDEALVAADLKALDAAAKLRKITLAEYLESVLVKGDISTVTDKLFAGIEYTVYAYGMSADGTWTTKSPIQKVSLTTKAVTKTSVTIAIAPEVKGTKCNVAFTPSDKAHAYYYSCTSEEDFLYLGGTAQDLALYALKTIVQAGADYGMTRAQTITQVQSVGDKTEPYVALKEHTKYYVFACAIDELGNIVSDIALANFTTAEFQGSKNTFEITVPEEDLSATNARIKIKVGNQDPFIWVTDKISKWNGRTNEQYIADYTTEWAWMLNMGWGTYTGDQDVLMSLTPGTPYKIIAFGYLKEVTTEPTTFEFSTKPGGDPTKTTFVFTREKLSPYGVQFKIVPSDNTVAFVAAVISKAKYEELGGKPSVIKPLIEADIAAFIAAYAEQGKTVTAADYVEQYGGYGESYISYSKDQAPLVPETDYIPYALPMNGDGTIPTTPTMGDGFRTPADVVSPATSTMEIPEYFDGDALAAARPDLYEGAKGRATSHVLIAHSADAVHWYCTSIEGDQSDLTAFPEEMVISNLLSNGQKDKDEVLFASPWDAPITFIAVAEDANGNYGVTQRIVKTFTKAGVTDPTDFLNKQPAPNHKNKALFQAKRHFDVASLLHPATRFAGMKPAAAGVDIPLRLAEQNKQTMPFHKPDMTIYNERSMSRTL